MRMMVKFLKIVYVGMEMYCRALAEVKIMRTRRNEIGDPMHDLVSV